MTPASAELRLIYKMGVSAQSQSSMFLYISFLLAPNASTNGRRYAVPLSGLGVPSLSTDPDACQMPLLALLHEINVEMMELLAVPTQFEGMTFLWKGLVAVRFLKTV